MDDREVNWPYFCYMHFLPNLFLSHQYQNWTIQILIQLLPRMVVSSRAKDFNCLCGLLPTGVVSIKSLYKLCSSSTSSPNQPTLFLVHYSNILRRKPFLIKINKNHINNLNNRFTSINLHIIFRCARNDPFLYNP